MLWLTLGLLGALAFATSEAQPGSDRDRVWTRSGPGLGTVGFVVDDVGLAPADARRALSAIGRETAGLDPSQVLTRLTSRTPPRGDGEGRMLDTVASILEQWTATPGRKGLVIFSAGLVAKAAPAPGAVRLPDAAIMARLRAIVRAAASAHTVLHLVNVPRFDAWVASRHALLDSPYDRAAEGPGFLADATGGVFFKNPGDLALATARAIADQQGYYLLGSEIDDVPVPAGAPPRSEVHERTPRTRPPRLPD